MIDFLGQVVANVQLFITTRICLLAVCVCLSNHCLELSPEHTLSTAVSTRDSKELPADDSLISATLFSTRPLSTES